MTAQRLALLVVVVAMIPISAVNGAGLEIAVGGWQQDPSGSFGYKAITVDDLIDVERDLRYGTENRLHGRARIGLPAFLPNIYLMAAPSEFEAIGRKAVDFRFGDQVFAADEDYYSKFKINQYDVALFYGLPFIRTATLNKLNIDVGINVRIFDLEAQIRQDATGITEKESITVPLPQLYLGAQLAPVKWLAIEAEGRGITIGGDSVYSLIGRLRLNAFGPVFVAGGYRYDTIDVDEDDWKVDFTIQGPFVEIGFKF